VPGAWCVAPNEQELRLLARSRPGGGPSGDDAPAPRSPLGALAAAGDALADSWRARSVCVTLGGSGALLCTPGGPPLMVRAPSVLAGDTCGAGDSFAAALAVALAGGALPSEAVGAAVEAAGRFVASGGAAAFDGSSRPPDSAPSASPTSAADLVSAVRRSGGTVVATGGCFDLLHAGHVATLEAARALGSCLVVLLNSDASVRRLKGGGRPLQPQQDRARVLGALQCVDAVVIFDEDTPSRTLEDLRPDVWAKGGDYSGGRLPEAEVLARWGGQVVTVPYLAGRSTTALVELAGTPAR
jgi:rfaE bifunctional protein nucleotidyltransferase chain/domain